MPEWWQKAIFYTLTFASLGYMGWQLFGRARYWMKGKPIDWRPDMIGNVWRFAIGQKKVQGSRPKSGAPMHLFLFYGFLSLTVATTLLAIATYAPVVGIPNFHKGTYYLVYEMTFDILGLGVVIGVLWALGRRVKLAKAFGAVQPDTQTGKLPHSRNPLTTEFKDYAALILILLLAVTGYVLEAARMANQPQPWDWSAPIGYAISQILPPISPGTYIAIWWFHMVWVWGFFCAIPHMRLKHIVTGTMSAAGKPTFPMGELRPISLAEVEETGKIGVAEAVDFSRWHLLSVDACMSCGRCTEVCPAYAVGKPLNPKQVVQDVHRTLVTGENVPATISEESLWACTTCHACVEACPVLIRHVDLIVDSRRNLVAEGKLSGTGAVMLRQVGSTANAWGQPANAREEWMKGLDIPLCRDGGEFDVLFWVGCAGATDPGAVKTTKAVAQLLKKAGVRFACLGAEEACTGDPARRIGDEFTFQGMAEQNVSVFEKYGVREVVTACPHCFNSLLNEYHQFGPRMLVHHHTQLLRRLIDEGKLKAAQLDAGEVTYHDPCYLARVNDISDDPRALVGQETHWDTNQAAIVHALSKEPDGPTALAEPEHKGRKTLCCGAGGGRMWMEEEPDQRPGNRRAAELLATGAKSVAVACPFCRIMLDASIKQVSKEDIQLVDMAELLNQANP